MQRFFNGAESIKKSKSSDKLQAKNVLSFIRGSKSRKHTPLISPQLPTELYGLILSFLSSSVKLYPLLFINSTFKSEVERILYSTISLAGDGLDPKRNYLERRINLFRRLANTPHLSQGLNP